jgi:L-arabinonolactonase
VPGTAPRVTPEIAFVGEQRDRLGESPLWDGQALLWIDIVAPCIHRLDPDTGARQRWAMPDLVGSIGLGPRPGTLVAALRHGLVLVGSEGEVSPLHALEPDPDLRLNDGKMDRQGRFLVGGMHLDRPDAYRAALHRFGPAGHEVLDRGFGTSNGLCLSPEGTTLYFADSRVGTLWSYTYDPESGALGARRDLADLTARHGSPPDGATVDAEGFIWAALVRSGQLVRLDPEGRTERLIDVPVPHPTCPAFGGAALDVLYVTSISDSGGLRSDHPDAGRLLEVRGLGVRGVAEARFGAASPSTTMA